MEIAIRAAGHHTELFYETSGKVFLLRTVNKQISDFVTP